MSPRPAAISAGARDESGDPHPVFSPLIAAAVTAVPGLVALATGQLLLFPSLGPTAVMQAHSPNHRSARIYNVVVSHFAGLAAADFAVLVFGLTQSPSVFAAHGVSPARVGAAALAMVLGTAVELALQAAHPPAASTTLLAALGSFKPNLHDTLDLVIGVLIVAIIGEVVRQLRLRRRV